MLKISNANAQARVQPAEIAVIKKQPLKKRKLKKAAIQKAAVKARRFECALSCSAPPE
jgi:hypothetical protein